MTFEFVISSRHGAFALDVAARGSARALALVGPSGSGKTTLLETIAGLRPAGRSRIVIDGRVFDDHSTNVRLATAERRVGYVPQDVLLFPHMTVEQNIRYGWRSGAPLDEAEAVRVLELAPLLMRAPGALSGGERQRVALARAVLSAPQVLLLDEPLAAVDLRHRARILDALVQVRDALGLPMIYVAHAPDEVRQIADHALAIEQGHVVAAGHPDAIRV